MEDDPDQLDRHVEDLLQDRRPPRTPLGSEDALLARQSAAMLRAARPGAGLPSRDFLRQAQVSINGWVRDRESQPAAEPRLSRRHLILSGLGGLAAGVVAALGIERLVRRPPPAPRELPLVAANRGRWVQVMALTEAPVGKPVRFSAGALEGYLVREGAEVRALSAVCTHMGCLLNWSILRDQFECPCHGATFEKSGMPTGKYASQLKRLPALQLRIEGGRVEIFTA